MSTQTVTISYNRTAHHEAAYTLQRRFIDQGYTNVNVVYDVAENVVIDGDGSYSWISAAALLRERETSLPIKLAITRNGIGLPLPKYETSGAAGMDLRAAIDDWTTMRIQPGCSALVPTGISVAVPPGYELQVRPRSGLAAKHAISIVNSPGTVDSDFRGEIKVILINHGHEPFEIERGDRIAQAVVAPVTRVAWVEVEALDETERGAGGYGSTGRA
jgi:dUTP pyrophosphatase